MMENVIAEYLRLSSEDVDLSDGIKLESNSIANQRNLLNSFRIFANQHDNAHYLPIKSQYRC